MTKPDSQLTVYLVPELEVLDVYDGQPVKLDSGCMVSDIRGPHGICIGIWRRRHDTWQIEIAVPVNVDVRPLPRN